LNLLAREWRESARIIPSRQKAFAIFRIRGHSRTSFFAADGLREAQAPPLSAWDLFATISSMAKDL